MRALVDGGVGEGFEEVALAGPGRPAHDDVFVTVDPLEGPERRWVRAGIELMVAEASYRVGRPSPVGGEVETRW